MTIILAVILILGGFLIFSRLQATKVILSGIQTDQSFTLTIYEALIA